jgi:hypothetical protein
MQKNNQADTEFHRVHTEFHRRDSIAALRASLHCDAETGHSTRNLTYLYETLCELSEILCPLDYFGPSSRRRRISNNHPHESAKARRQGGRAAPSKVRA